MTSPHQRPDLRIRIETFTDDRWQVRGEPLKLWRWVPETEKPRRSFDEAKGE